MSPLFSFKDCFFRAFQRKIIIVIAVLLLLCSTMCGIIFAKTPAFYEYHLKMCDRFLDRVCYSDRSVFLIFLERTAGNALLLVLVLAGGLHPALLPIPAVVLVFRGYACGGTLTILFSVYGFSGALVALALYLPIRLLADCALLLGAGNACACAFLRGGPRELLCDFLPLFLFIAAVCLLEMILLLALFHPMGNLL